MRASWRFLRLRGRFLLAAGLGLAGLAGLADVAVGVLYDAHTRGGLDAGGAAAGQLVHPARQPERGNAGGPWPLADRAGQCGQIRGAGGGAAAGGGALGAGGALLAMVAAEALRFAVLAHEMPRDLRLARQDLALSALVAGLMAAIALGRGAGPPPVWQGAFS
jgi:hypothetical protein